MVYIYLFSAHESEFLSISKLINNLNIINKLLISMSIINSLNNKLYKKNFFLMPVYFWVYLNNIIIILDIYDNAYKTTQNNENNNNFKHIFDAIIKIKFSIYKIKHIKLIQYLMSLLSVNNKNNVQIIILLIIAKQIIILIQ